MGLVSKVFSAEELLPKTLEVGGDQGRQRKSLSLTFPPPQLAEKIASFSMPAVQMAKEAVNKCEGGDGSWEGTAAILSNPPPPLPTPPQRKS